MITLSSLVRYIACAAGLLDCEPESAFPSFQRPIYAIAHRVLRPEAVTAALSHGANAIEVDLTAQSDGWWADHDGTGDSAGTTARELFELIAHERQNGQNVIFVWLDIKNPDECGEEERSCSIEGLRDLVREILEPAQVRALYGFFQQEDSRGLSVMRETLDSNEAIALSGPVSDVLDLYAQGTSVHPHQRIMDYGNPQLDEGFGSCHEVDPDNFICPELRDGSTMRDWGRLGKTFGWTSTEGDSAKVFMLLRASRADGVIYGFQEDDYADDPVTRAAFQDILGFVNDHSTTHRMATIGDAPW
ncbi:glycerophosphodiester phosphodiesterase family protein [Aspergillus lucknowensis]|uniref:Phospholipase D n=1 Tax=Aspergillus lucknowensis TaxID=176173 RepID=A0ABR4M1N1_9EURO